MVSFIRNSYRRAKPQKKNYLGVIRYLRGNFQYNTTIDGGTIDGFCTSAQSGRCERFFEQNINKLPRTTTVRLQIWPRMTFSCFQNSNCPLRGTRIESIEKIKTKSQRKLKAITEYTFKKLFDDWFVRWKKCIASEEVYFEGDITNLDD